MGIFRNINIQIPWYHGLSPRWMFHRTSFFWNRIILLVNLLAPPSEPNLGNFVQLRISSGQKFICSHIAAQLFLRSSTALAVAAGWWGQNRKIVQFGEEGTKADYPLQQIAQLCSTYLSFYSLAMRSSSEERLLIADGDGKTNWWCWSLWTKEADEAPGTPLAEKKSAE